MNKGGNTDYIPSFALSKGRFLIRFFIHVNKNQLMSDERWCSIWKVTMIIEILKMTLKA